MTELDKTYSSLAVIEQFEKLIANLSGLAQVLPDQYQSELEVHLTTLKSLVELLDVDGVMLPDGLKLTGALPRSIIERLGAGGELIRLRAERKHTLAELSTQFGISEPTIRRFFKIYENASKKEQIRMRRTSIFDTTQQLEDLAVVIQRGIARLEGGNDEVGVKFIGEMRQLIELATKFAEKMANYERMTRLQEVIAEILINELPHKKVEILKKIRAASISASSSLLPAQTEDLSIS
ncbi:hypothetical protein OsccyDRAFT_0716 [Leptolyngbyaceae cyanobacterium JSC-12]|nr:hypothetical protein OsccyDRAFT_0716 [Leptolyngbyaceae cyanobacterium JSC-12]